MVVAPQDNDLAPFSACSSELEPIRGVTRELDHRKSDVSDLRPSQVPELGNTRVLLIHVFARKNGLRPKSDVSDFANSNRAEVGNTRLGVKPGKDGGWSPL
jgi:hypothetical protein